MLKDSSCEPGILAQIYPRGLLSLAGPQLQALHPGSTSGEHHIRPRRTGYLLLVQRQPLHSHLATDAQFVILSAHAQFGRSSDAVQVCLCPVETARIVTPPEFEELRAPQWLGPDVSMPGVGFVYYEKHLAESVLGGIHQRGLVRIRNAYLRHRLTPLRLCASHQQQYGGKHTAAR
jgi:hypothetical protein